MPIAHFIQAMKTHHVITLKLLIYHCLIVIGGGEALSKIQTIWEIINNITKQQYYL